MYWNCRFFNYRPEDGYCTLCRGDPGNACCHAGGGGPNPLTDGTTTYSGTRDKIDENMAYDGKHGI